MADIDIWDLRNFELDPETLARYQRSKALPRHGPRDSFIRGPIPYYWLLTACRLPGPGLQVSLSYWFYERRFRYRQRGKRWSIAETAKGLQISMDTVRRALHAAELAGLLTVEREPGCKLVVSTRDVPELEPKRWPLYGPIPWNWWVLAARLPGRTLHVGIICWLVAGWKRSAEFELVLNQWDEFGLGRASVARGLTALESAGLVSVSRIAGQSPIVTILNLQRNRSVRGTGVKALAEVYGNPPEAGKAG
jgi:hypothetical protein